MIGWINKDLPDWIKPIDHFEETKHKIQLKLSVLNVLTSLTISVCLFKFLFKKIVYIYNTIINLWTTYCGNIKKKVFKQTNDFFHHYAP